MDLADEGTSLPALIRTWSDVGGLADKDFAEFTVDEMMRARLALERLVWRPGERRTRRWIPGRGSRVDLRRALARSLRTGGDVITLPRRTRRVRPRPIVLLCDVSGSMERYSRMLLHFAHALTRRQRRVEAFLFSTGLTRITMQLRARRITEAVSAVAKAVPDWSGGTRIGAAIRQFHQQWTRRALRGGPVVLLISDGWDRGDPEVLRTQVARLQRSCHRLIWLNPLIGTVGYEPLTRGLQAALPFVDDFLPARTLTNLADLALHLNTLSAGRSQRTGRPTAGPALRFVLRPHTDGYHRLIYVQRVLRIGCGISSWIPRSSPRASPAAIKLEPTGEDRYRASLTVALAAITGSYEGTVVNHREGAPRVVSSQRRRPGQAGIRERQCGDHASPRWRDDDRGRQR